MSNGQNIFSSFLQEYSPKVNGLILQNLKREIEEISEIDDFLKEILSRFKNLCLGGKKLRSGLLLLSYLSNGGKEVREVYKIGAWYEIFCTGVLVQDDVMDEGVSRRGLETLHRQYAGLSGKVLPLKAYQIGENIAVCIGDWAYFIAYLGILKTGLEDKIKIRVLKLLSSYFSYLALGQAMDVFNTQISSVSEEKILKIIKIKSGEYSIALPLLLGAVLAGITEEKKLKLIYDFGIYAGYVFQLRDDILGIFGEEEETGKSVSSDLEEGKITLLQYYLYKYGDRREKGIQKRLLGKKTINQKELILMKNILQKTGSLERVEKLIEKYSQKAGNLIVDLAEQEKYQELFAGLIDFLKTRKK